MIKKAPTTGESMQSTPSASRESASKRRSQSRTDSAWMTDRSLCVIVQHVRKRSDEARPTLSELPDSAGAMKERVAVVIDTRTGDFEARMPLPIVRSLLDLSRVIPAGVRDAGLEALARRGIRLDAGRGGDLEDRIMRQLSQIDVNVKTQKLRVRVFTE
jgi:hypothetical protein